MTTRRHLIFLALMTFGLLLVFEGISFFVASWVDGRRFSYQPYEQKRSVIVGEAKTSEVVHLGPDPAQELGAGNITSKREILHPFLGFVFNPDVNEKADAQENGGLKVNQHGFFTTPGEPQPTEDEVRIGIFGGSVAMLFALHGQDLLVEKLRQAPSLANRKITVRSYALGGYKQPQQLLTLSYLLSLGERFDAIVNIDGFNEMALAYFDNYQHGVYPFYPRAWKQRVDLVPDREFQVKVAHLSILRARRASLARHLSSTPLAYSVTANLLWALFDRKLAADLQNAQLDLAALPASDNTYRWQGPFERFDDDKELFERMARQWRDSSLQMHYLAEANSIRYLHVLQPNQYLKGSKPMKPEEERLALDPNSPYRRAIEIGYPHLRETGQSLTEQGVRFFDATMIFRSSTMPLYTDGCCHFNRQGNQILAQAIAEQLLLE